MALWGISDSDESKPKNLTAAEKKEVFANASGWVREAGSALSGNGNVNADPELLVAVSGLAVKIGSADITEIEFITTAFDKSEGGTLQVRVRFNEAVDVTGTPQLTVVNDTNSNHTLSYASAATDAGDELSIGSNAMSLNSGSVKDAGTSTNSTITNSGAIGTAAGTITVEA